MTKITFQVGDITKLSVDVIVNSANPYLIKGSGVSGAIHNGAGGDLEHECKNWLVKEGREVLPKGEAMMTYGYNLPAKYVIHTVGPVYEHSGGRDAELLENCYYNSLELARIEGLRTIAFPSISTGAYGYPINEAVAIATRVVQSYVKTFPEAFDAIIFCLYSQSNYETYKFYFSNLK